jgi:hypothetical protein
MLEFDNKNFFRINSPYWAFSQETILKLVARFAIFDTIYRVQVHVIMYHAPCLTACCVLDYPEWASCHGPPPFHYVLLYDSIMSFRFVAAYNAHSSYLKFTHVC